MVGFERRDRVFAVVLAAGSATRFGRTKQLELIDGAPLVERALRTARRVCGTRTTLVAGHDRESVIRAAGGSLSYLVVNDRHEDGMGSSIAAAIRVLAHTAGAMLLMLADQPLVTARHLEKLLATWSGSDHEIVATAFDGTQGPPVLFPRATFAELARLTGDSGARTLLHDKTYRLKTIEFAGAAVDVDTPADLARL